MLELESVHVPKTAGMSFLKILQHWYGEPFVALHQTIGASPIYPETRVMHGHFPAGTYRAERRISWVRDPAKRLLSSYFFLRYQQPPNFVQESRYTGFHQQVWAGGMSLDEYVHHPLTRRGMALWFHDLELDDFDFVGIQEDFNREVARCALALDQPVISIDGGENITTVPEYREFLRTCDPGLFDQLRELHPDCTALYQEALARSTAWWDEHPEAFQAAA